MNLNKKLVLIIIGGVAVLGVVAWITLSSSALPGSIEDIGRDVTILGTVEFIDMAPSEGGPWFRMVSRKTGKVIGDGTRIDVYVVNSNIYKECAETSRNALSAMKVGDNVEVSGKTIIKDRVEVCSSDDHYVVIVDGE